MANVQNYKCPACGGPLAFDAGTGKLTCSYCDSSFEPSQIAGDHAESVSFDGNAGWNTSSLSSDWGDEADSVREYNCPSCGAVILCDKTTAATSCPYCGNPTIVETQFEGSLHPDCIIPFKLKKDDAVSALKEFYKSKPLLPKTFAEQNHLEEAKGIYVPFWFFDGTASGSAVFKTTAGNTQSRGQETVHVTRYYECRRAGEVSFKLVPVDASKQMDDELMDSIEPYDYSGMQPFSTGFLPGYYADIHDVSAEDCFARANTRCAQTFLRALRGTVTGYDTCTLAEKHITLTRGTVRYGLLPVYVLNTKCDGKTYTFAVNGQSGKVVGNLPSSKGRSAGRFFGKFFLALAIGAALVFALATFTGSPDLFLPMGVFSAIIALMTAAISLSRDKAKMRTVGAAAEANAYTEGKVSLSVKEDIFKNQTVSVVSQQQNPQVRPGGPAGNGQAFTGYRPGNGSFGGGGATGSFGPRQGGSPLGGGPFPNRPQGGPRRPR